MVVVAFLDVVGFVGLMAEDEARTLPRWMQLLTGVLRPLASIQGGRIVKSTGDGVLATFPTAANGVNWALDVQTRAREIDASDADSLLAPMALRIALHQGVVVQTEDDVYGHVVNTAARLQEHCEPGGLIISAAVLAAAGDEVELTSVNLGPIAIRGAPDPCYAHGVAPPGPVRVRRETRRGPVPSIAILPLRNLSHSEEDRFLAEGIVEDVILSLASSRELMVISRGSTMALGADADPQAVGRELAVRYVLEGSFRRSDSEIKVSVRLHDAELGTVLWASSVQVPSHNLFDVQDEIVTLVIGGTAPHIRGSELRRAFRKRPDSITAYELTLRALDIMNRLDQTSYPRALAYLEQAMDIDPANSMALAWAARWHSLNVGQGWSVDRDKSIAITARLAHTAIALDSQNALALATYGHVQSFHLHDHEAGLSYLERALAASPSMSLAWALSAGTLAYVGRGVEAVRHGERSLRLSPFDPGIYATYSFLSFGQFACGDYRQALSWARRSRAERPSYTACLRMMAASYALLGEPAEAAAVAGELLHLEPEFSLRQYAATRLPFRPRELRDRFIEGLSSAGLPQ